MSSVAAPALRVCARHERIAAPASCACGAPLCSACARFNKHERCPSCAVTAGGAPVERGAMWYATLLVDTLVSGLRPLALRAATVALSLIAVGSALAFGLAVVVGDDPFASRSLPLEIVAGVVGVAAVLAFCAQPAAWAPLARPVSLPRTTLRAAPVGLFVCFLGALGLLFVGGTVALLDSVDVHILLSVLVAVFCALLVCALGLLALPWAFILFGAAVFDGAALRAARPGLRSFGAVALAHIAASTMGYSLSAIPLMAVTEVGGGGGAVVVGVAGAWGMTVTLLLQGAFIGATWRYLQDLRSVK